ncbi:shikimate dehydrogenase [Streptomyces sp. V3I8]|jgi:shikimate dehydrogenase|uniref:shikimate dehydrogenase n=1 Tax=Streptomyces sp. V3I8 TaxID=3042279 RepID=UPI002789EC95|nr:shikimate dehydrogenase [Streptomyces sp. V3I8]MDQ1040726.1 shikimate dehydrogenase [Streptomyces sp. V3I8]
MAQSSYLVGLIGSDTGRSLAVDLHEREARRHHLRYLCRRVDADGQVFRGKGMPGLLRTCRTFGFAGLGVAAPYRHTVAPHLDELSGSAARLQAVDVIVFTRDGRTVGHNTDVAGHAAAMARGLPGVPLTRVVQIGTGAAGIAVAHALREQKAAHLCVTDPVPDRARALAEQLNRSTGHHWAEAFPAEELAARLRGADGLVNTLPSSGTGGQGASLYEALHKDLWIFDAHGDPVHSPLLRAGDALGCRVLDAGGVLVNEAAAAFRLVTGLTPHTSHMFGDLADLRAEPRAHT